MSSSGGYEKYITMAASVAATAMVVRSVMSELLPYEVRDLLCAAARYLRSRVSSRHTVVIDEAEGLSANQIYDAARTYLAARISTDMPRLRVSRVDETQGIMVGMEQGEEMVDVHDGVEYTWNLVARDNTPGAASRAAGTKARGRLEIKSFEVTFHKKHKDKALESYLPHIVATAKAMKDQHRNLKMHMIEYDAWTAVDLRHPSTFDTLAMDKKLLYGPPGTGKSSLIAAMANYLKFDIYDLELTEVKSNSDLRRLLVGMSNRSILVVEDIDCSIDLRQREEGEKRVRSSSMLLGNLLNR